MTLVPLLLFAALESELRTLVHGLCKMNNKQLQAVSHLLQEEHIEQIKIAMNIPPTNQVGTMAAVIYAVASALLQTKRMDCEVTPEACPYIHVLLVCEQRRQLFSSDSIAVLGRHQHASPPHNLGAADHVAAVSCSCTGSPETRGPGHEAVAS